MFWIETAAPNTLGSLSLPVHSLQNEAPDLYIQQDTQGWACSTSLEDGAPRWWGDILKSIFLLYPPT